VNGELGGIRKEMFEGVILASCLLARNKYA
jgi:hypothetical protein